MDNLEPFFSSRKEIPIHCNPIPLRAKVNIRISIRKKLQGGQGVNPSTLRVILDGGR